jgi:hypothetical protein
MEFLLLWADDLDDLLCAARHLAPKMFGLLGGLCGLALLGGALLLAP